MRLGLYTASPFMKRSGGAAAAALESARFIGNTQYARSAALTLGGVGAINFEVQALVYMEGARASQNRIMMVQFPAGRQAGQFCSNLTGNNIVCGDSQLGTLGSDLANQPTSGKWYLMTFSADGTTGTSGLWKHTAQALDGSLVYTSATRTKGVEASLQGNRVDLNGGGVDFGWTNGIRYAEVRAYNSQRTDVQRQADLTNTDPTGAVFWWRFSNDGSGGVTVEDRSGNGILPTLTGATLSTGPTL